MAGEAGRRGTREQRVVAAIEERLKKQVAEHDAFDKRVLDVLVARAEERGETPVSLEFVQSLSYSRKQRILALEVRSSVRVSKSVDAARVVNALASVGLAASLL